MSTSEESEEYEIERILADDTVDGVDLFLVKWKDYPDEECTWEPVENFNSPASLAEWRHQKAHGLGLDDYFLADVQRRMDEFQAQVQHSSKVNDPNASPSDESLPIDQGPSKRQKKTHEPSSIVPPQKPRSKAEPPHKKGIAAPIRPSSTFNSSTANPRSFVVGPLPDPRPRKATVMASKSKGQLPSKAGQRFRNLSHMNNARKKAREEPPPTLSPGRLRPIGDFNIGRDVAHALPLPIERRVDNDNSPLFIPDANDVGSRRAPSPALSDSVLFPPAKVDHQPRAVIASRSEGTSKDLKSSSNAQISNPQSEAAPLSVLDAKTTATEDTVSRMSVIQRSAQVDHSEIALETATTNLQIDPGLAPLPPKDTIVRASNGRSWYRGDVMCYFLMGGTPIGDATVVHLQFFPYGQCLVRLKASERLSLHFEPQAFSQTEFEEAFTNHYVQPEAIGLINPFFDTRQAFHSYADYLEKHNAAAVFHLPDDIAYMSLMLYSINSKPWRRLGYCAGRADIARPRLYLAFVPRLVARTPQRKSIAPATDAVIPLSSTGPISAKVAQRIPVIPAQQGTGSLSRQHTRSPSAGLKSTELADHETQTSKSPAAYSSGFSSAPQSPPSEAMSLDASPVTVTPASPQPVTTVTLDLRRKLSRHVVDKPQAYPSISSTSDGATSGSRHRELFDQLTAPYASTSRLKLETKKAQFFISFAKTDPGDSKAMQTYLEKYVPPSSVYLDSERHDWVRFKEKIESVISVILFSHDNPNHNRLPGLGQILGSEIPSCFLVSLKRNPANRPEVSQTSVQRLFPRMTMYLITESMIVDHLDQTMSIVKYFDSSKKPGYQMMTRPDIERWLVEHAAGEKDVVRQSKLISLLILVRGLNPGSECEFDVDANGDIQVSTAQTVSKVLGRPSYILSPRSIPGYDKALATDNKAAATSTASSMPQPQPDDVHERRDDILRSYFYCYAAVHATKYRRFIDFIPRSLFPHHEAKMKQKEQDKMLDCGHIFFWELEKFVERHCQPRIDKKRQPTQQGATKRPADLPKRL